MAQPIAPQAFGEAAAAKWLQAAISPEGCLADVFSRAVKAAVQADLGSQTGAIPLAVTAAIEPYKQAAENQDTVIEGLQSRLAAAETRLQAYQKLEDDLDTAFSWRKCERDTDSQEWLAAWRRLFVDKDWLANVADQMHDPAMANAVAVCVANPQNPEAAKLKQAISMRNAPKTSLKELCLSTHGGGPDRFRAFMSDKAASTDDKVMAAVAKKALGFFLLVENQYVSPATAKATSAAKISAQKAEMMPLVFAAVKAMKLRAKKATARVDLEHVMLQKGFQMDWSLALSRLAACPFVMSSGPPLAPVASSGQGPPGAPPVKRLRGESATSGSVLTSQPQHAGKGVPQPPQPAGGKGGAAKKRETKEVVAAMVTEFTGMMGRQQPAAIQSVIDAKLQGPPEAKAAMRSIMGTYCRHCLLNSKAVVQHSRAQCMAMGNLPATPCPKCIQKFGRVEYHWVEKCGA